MDRLVTAWQTVNGGTNPSNEGGNGQDGAR